jgi:hypothetical protein
MKLENSLSSAAATLDPAPPITRLYIFQSFVISQIQYGLPVIASFVLNSPTSLNDFLSRFQDLLTRSASWILSFGFKFNLHTSSFRFKFCSFLLNLLDAKTYLCLSILQFQKHLKSLHSSHPIHELLNHPRFHNINPLFLPSWAHLHRILHPPPII